MRLGVALVPEGRQVFTRYTVRENLAMGAYHRADREHIEPDIEEIFSLFPRLGGAAEAAGRLMSGGEQQMLAIGRGLMAKPRLLLDEPTLGLAPIMVEEIERIVQLAARGMTILIAEQNAAMALESPPRLCARRRCDFGRRHAGAIESLPDRRAIVFRRGARGGGPCVTPAQPSEGERSTHVKSPAAR